MVGAEAVGLSLEASLPERPLWMLADATRIVQSVSNLLVNAVKFTPRGGHVAVALVAEPGTAVVTVSDDGMGMDREMLDRLFEPFSQADRSLDRSLGERLFVRRELIRPRWQGSVHSFVRTLRLSHQP